MLPQELGCGSGMTCWRRLRDWQLAGVWGLIHFALLDWLARDDQIDWSRAVVDSCSIRAVYGGDQTGPNPTDRAKRGSKRHLICDGRGVPLAVRLPVRIGTTRRKSPRWWTRFPHCTAPADDRGNGLTACSGIGATTRRRFGASPDSSHRALPGHAPHRAWEWFRPVALGRGAHVRVAQSVSPSARSLRQTDRHPRGLSLVGMRADLLAVPSQEVVARLEAR